MIPTKLILRNFLPYKGEVALDLRTIRVACIAGDNGAGKSSLLDAMTWALWGKARGGAERDLMSLGTTEMGVDFQFLLGEQEYRVLRRRRRRGSSPDVAQLEVQLRDATPDDDAPWRAITGDTLSQTQKLLTRSVGMEYDTFINSAFILQGRADEFTTKGATDRKQVLADILGLGRYDELEESARGLRREAEVGRKAIDAKLEQIAHELAGRPAAEEELGRVSAALIALIAALGALTDEYDAARARRAELERRDEAAREAERRREEHAREAERLRARVAAAEARIAALARIIADAPKIRAGYAELQEAIGRDGAANAALATLNELQGRYREAEKRVDAARSRLLQEQHALDHQSVELARQQERLPELEKRYTIIAARLKEAGEVEGRRATLTASVTSATEEIGGRRSENERLKKEMHRVKSLQTQMDDAGAICTLCRRPVGEHERQHIHDEYQADGLRLKEEYTSNLARVRELEAEIAACNTQLEEVATLAREGLRLAREEGDLRRQLTTARDAGVTLLDVNRNREQLGAQLARGNFAREAQAEIGELTAAIAGVAYDREAHRQVRARINDLRPFDTSVRELERAEHAIDPERERLTEDQATLALREESRALETARVVELRAGLDGLPALIRRCDDLAIELDTQRRQQDELTRRQGRLEESLRRLADLDDEDRRLRDERRTLSEAESAYRDLARAFGKGGIQAMIIEGAVPELQDEANAILANMPGNSMRVEFRTQRETRKGDTVEALEIVIGDEAGQRDYAMFSGGEAFRINFAIRVALAKLLARRAGAKLQMLVIDEGFGTQDARGRDSLVEAIHAIEGEFATILVITHVQELRELFPTQILVEKGLAGAQISIS
jgi:exonuclease SbcC